MGGWGHEGTKNRPFFLGGGGGRGGKKFSKHKKENISIWVSRKFVVLSLSSDPSMSTNSALSSSQVHRHNLRFNPEISLLEASDQ